MGLREDLKAAFDAIERVPLQADRILVSEADYADLMELDRRCQTVGHPGRGRPRSECPHPDCVVKHVLEE